MDSNHRPSHSKCAALPTAPLAQLLTKPTRLLVPSGGLEPPSPSLKGSHPGPLDDDGKARAGCENRTRITGLEARGTANIPNPQWRRVEDTILTDFSPAERLAGVARTPAG